MERSDKKWPSHGRPKRRKRKNAIKYKRETPQAMQHRSNQSRTIPHNNKVQEEGYSFRNRLSLLERNIYSQEKWNFVVDFFWGVFVVILLDLDVKRVSTMESAGASNSIAVWEKNGVSQDWFLFARLPYRPTFQLQLHPNNYTHRRTRTLCCFRQFRKLGFRKLSTTDRRDTSSSMSET